LLTLNQLTDLKRQTGHNSCCPVNHHTLMRRSGWTICVSLRAASQQSVYAVQLGRRSQPRTLVTHTH